MDLNQHTLEKLYTERYPSGYIRIDLNKTDPTTFILIDFFENASKICKIVDKTIIIGEIIDILTFREGFYGKYVYSLTPNHMFDSRVSLLFTCIVNILNISDSSS